MARWIVPAGSQAELDAVVNGNDVRNGEIVYNICLLYTSPSPRD